MSISDEQLRQVLKTYDKSTVWYARDILGLRKAAEGLVYPMFNDARHVVDEIPWQALQRGRWYICVDYGTVNPTAAGLWCLWQGTAYMVQEYYYDSRKPGNHQLTDEEHYIGIEKLAGDRRIERVIVDPSAASFKEKVVTRLHSNSSKKGRFRPAANRTGRQGRILQTRFRDFSGCYFHPGLL